MYDYHQNSCTNIERLEDNDDLFIYLRLDNRMTKNTTDFKSTQLLKLFYFGIKDVTRYVRGYFSCSCSQQTANRSTIG